MAFTRRWLSVSSCFCLQGLKCLTCAAERRRQTTHPQTFSPAQPPPSGLKPPATDGDGVDGRGFLRFDYDKYTFLNHAKKEKAKPERGNRRELILGFEDAFCLLKMILN